MRFDLSGVRANFESQCYKTSEDEVVEYATTVKGLLARKEVMTVGERPSMTEREMLRQSTCGAAAACALKFPVAPFILARMLTAWNKSSLLGLGQFSSVE